MAAKANPKGTVIGVPQAVGFHEGTKALSDAAGTPWDNKVTVQTLYYQRRWEPTVYLPQISIPVLYVTAKYDEFTPHDHHMAAYEKITGPKELMILDSENLATFMDEKTRNKAFTKTIDFLKHNL